jgi:hypothetical protein
MPHNNEGRGKIDVITRISPHKIFNLTEIPPAFCASLSLPWAPLNMKQAITTGEIIALTTAATGALALGGAGAFALSERHKANQQNLRRQPQPPSTEKPFNLADELTRMGEESEQLRQEEADSDRLKTQQ